MTRFLCDVRFARPHTLDGVGRFLWSMARHLPEALRPGETLTLLAVDDDVASWRAHVPGVRVVATSLPTASWKQQVQYDHVVSGVGGEGADVVFYPQYDVPHIDGARIVCCVYDLTVIDEPTYYGRGRWPLRLLAGALLARGCARADRIVTLSRASANALEARYAGTRGKVRVVTPGPGATTVTPTTPQFLDFVYVGNHRPHKRLPLLLRAFSGVRKAHPEARLTLIGRPDARFPEVPSLLGGPLGDGVELVVDASEEEAATRIARASALVFASVGEGFGFPVVEAFALGTPVVVAAAGSLPEVAGAGGIHVVPPDDVDAWRAALERIGTNRSVRDAHAAAGRQIVAQLDWRRTASDLVEVWRETLA